jgi:predicted ATPase
MKTPPLSSFGVNAFKAIRNSGSVDFGWLTAFVGNNGVGKSSLIEALETVRNVVFYGVDMAFARWRGYEHVWNKATERTLERIPGERAWLLPPMAFGLNWNRHNATLYYSQNVAIEPDPNKLFIWQETLSRGLKSQEKWARDESGDVKFTGERVGKPPAFELAKHGDGQSMLAQSSWIPFDRWQFLMLNPERMGQPTPQQRAANEVRLATDGANLAQYLNEIRELDPNAFSGLLDTIRVVLPYASHLQPKLTSELERAFYLTLKEEQFEVPGWLISQGTLRIVALLACLRHPKPPPLLVVEEIENGLDPRTLQLLVAEIRAAIEARRTQVILTTHSPYLLDLLDLSHIIVVEREDGQPVFRRPDANGLKAWSKTFAPGRLYRMGRLTRSDR